jgi:hypothetical protein
MIKNLFIYRFEEIVEIQLDLIDHHDWYQQQRNWYQ